MKKLITGIACVMLLAGCGDSFAGTYEFAATGETLTVKSNGTCVDRLDGMEVACTWEKVGTDTYQLNMNTIFGSVPFTAEKKGSGTYEINSIYGGSQTMKKK